MLAVMLCLLLCGAMTVSATKDPVIAAFEFSNEGAVMETNIELNGYGDKDKGYNSTTGDAELYASVNGTNYRKLEWTKDNYSDRGLQPAMTGGNNNPWGETAWFEVQVSTRGYDNLAFSAELGGTKKGPRDYQLQYSLDGKTFANVGNVVSLSDNKILEKLFDGVALPADAANAEMLYIRMTVASDQTIGGAVTLNGSTGGDAVVNNIVIIGSTVGETTTDDTQTGGNNTVLFIVIGAVALALVIAVVVIVLLVKKKSKE